MMWNDPYPLVSEGCLGGLALSHIYRLTLVRRAKSTYVQYNYRRLTTDPKVVDYTIAWLHDEYKSVFTDGSGMIKWPETRSISIWV